MTSEAKAGAVVLFVVAVAIAAWAKLGGLSFLGDTYVVTVCFEDLLGLPEGAKVRLAGADIGEVEEVGVEFRSDFPGKLAYARLRIKNEFTLYHGYKFQVASGSLLGDRHIRVTVGDPRGEAIDKKRPVVIAGSPPGGIDALTTQAEDIARQAGDAMQNLDAILGDPALQANLKDTFANLKVLSERATMIADKALSLVGDVGPGETEKISELIDNLHSVSMSLRRTAAGVNAMVATTTMPEDMNTITQNLADASASVKETAAAVEDMVADPMTSSDIRTTLGNVKDMTASGAESVFA